MPTKIKVRLKYYKHTNRDRDPVQHHSWIRQRDNFREVNTTIYLDPIFRKHRLKDIKKSVLKHERMEILALALGASMGKAHKYARSQELKVTKGMRLRDFWKEVDRRLEVKHG